jgi:hypothetical protein
MPTPIAQAQSISIVVVGSGKVYDAAQKET